MEVSLGDLTAYIRADLTHFQRGMQTVQQQLGQVQQRLQGQNTAQQQAQQSSQQLAAATLAMAQAITQQTQAYSQAQSATLAFRQAQAQVAQQTQAQRAALQQAAQGIRQHAQELQSERLEIARNNQALRERQQQLRETAQAARGGAGGGGAFAGVLQVAGGIGLATGIGALVSQLREIATTTVQVGARFEQLQVSFNAIAGSAANGARQFQFVTDTAQRLGVGLEPIARGFRQLTAAASQTSLTIAEQQRLIAALATEGRRVGASNEEMSRAFTALSQVASKGTLSMEELRGQLGEAIPTALIATAKGMGITTEALIKLVETGTIRFEPFAKAFTRGLEQMSDSSGKLADTATSAFNRLLTEFQLLAKAIMESGLSRYLATVAGNLQEAVRFTRETLAPTPFTAPTGPNLAELGVSTAQAQQLRRLDEGIRKAQQDVELAQRAGPRDELSAENERLTLAQKRLQVLQTMRDQLLEGAKATQAQAEAQAAVTAETNKTTHAREQEAAFVENVRKTLETINRETAEFRTRAAQFPERYGRLGGTPEDIERFRKGLEDLRAKQQEQLAGVFKTQPPGFQLPADLQQQVRAIRQEYAQLGVDMKAADQAERDRTKAVREAESARQKAIREAQQEAETYQAAIDKVTVSLARQEEQALQTLARLQSQFSESQAERAETLVSRIAAQFPDNEAIQQQVALTQQVMATREAYLAELDAAQASFAVIKERTALLVQAEEAQANLSQRIEAAITQARGTRAERPELRLRAEAEQAGLTLTPEQEARLQVLTRTREEQERLQYTLHLFEQTAQAVGTAWTSALESIATGTRTVSEAFREMARSILQSLAQIASQEAFRALIRMGIGIISSIAAGSAGAGTGAGFGGGTGIDTGLQAGFPALTTAQGFQHGGVVTRPTLALLGENPSMNPETVLNRPQMEHLMQGQARGGGTGGVTVINVASRDQAEQEAARERSLGKQVVINYINENLALGESSSILRQLRTLQR